MFDYAPKVADYDWLEDAEITPRMLRTLKRIGPGGVITADLFRGDYYPTHARTLNLTSHIPLIVYGYHDLAGDLDEYSPEYGGRAWQELAAAVDCTAYECLDTRVRAMAATGLVVTRTRQHLQKLGFDLTSAPFYYDRYATPGDDTAPATPMVQDCYADRSNPTITVTVKSPLQEQIGGLSLTTVSDHGRHVTGWPKALRNQFIASANVRRVSGAVDAYLHRNSRP